MPIIFQGPFYIKTMSDFINLDAINGKNGIYILGVSRMVENHGTRFFPLNIGEGKNIIKRLKDHYTEGVFLRAHAIFNIEPSNAILTIADVIDIYSSIQNWIIAKPTANHNRLNDLVAINRLLWFNWQDYFTAILGGPSSYDDGNPPDGVTKSLNIDSILWSNALNTDKLKLLNANRKKFLDTFTFFYAETQNNNRIIEGKVKWFFEQFGYFVHSHANHMVGLIRNAIPPLEFDFTAINNQLVQGVLTNPDGIIPPNIPDLVNII